METLLTYIFKSAGLLSIFYLAYIVLLKRDTNFQVNRRFLLGGICAAAVLPAIYFTRKVVVEANNFSLNQIPTTTQEISDDLVATFGVWEVLGAVYIFIATFFLSRIAFQFYGILKLISNSTISKNGDFKFIKTDTGVSPFSFFKFIVYNPETHSEQDLEMILLHEKIHASQKHSLDIIIANLTTALLWFNPLSWLYKKSVEQNLEYIADRETVALSGTKKSYQKALVKVSITNSQPALTNHFYQSFIKKRILMLNKKPSQNSGLWKVSLVFPLVLAFMLAFNVKTEAKTNISSQETTSPLLNKFEITIQKTNSNAVLNEFSKLARKNNIRLKFDNLKRSTNGEIVNIKTTFRDLQSKQNGEIVLSNSNGISPLVLSRDANGAISLFSTKENLTNLQETKPKTITESAKTSKEIPGDPIYILNGEKSKKEIIHLIDKDLIESINVLKGESAISLYGEEAKDGAVIITTKVLDKSFKRKKGKARSFGFQRFQRKTDQEIISGKEIGFRTGEDINAFQWTKESDEKTNFHIKLEEKIGPVIIIDGKKSNAATLKEIEPENIEKINVLKGKSVIDKYGEKVENGIIEVTTRKEIKE